jgi:hypothetical protein
LRELLYSYRQRWFYTHTHTHVWRKYRHIYKNNKQKLRLIYPTWNSIIRPRLFFRARGWELAVVIDPPRGNWVPELPSGGGRCHSPRCTSTHARYICTIYAQHKVAGKRCAVKNKKNLISYIHARMLHVLHHRSHGCTSLYYLISNAASFDLVCYLYIQPLGQITLKSFSLLLLYTAGLLSARFARHSSLVDGRYIEPTRYNGQQQQHSLFYTTQIKWWDCCCCAGQ